MAIVNIYLTFNGNCEEAFNFYREVFGGDFEMISRYSEMPPQNGTKIPDEFLDKIMHVSLSISKETGLMGSDVSGDSGPEFIQGNNFSISVDAESKELADTIFEKLSEEGEVVMPMDKTFWGSYFGMCMDKFGINWMVSFME